MKTFSFDEAFDLLVYKLQRPAPPPSLPPGFIAARQEFDLWLPNIIGSAASSSRLQIDNMHHSDKEHFAVPFYDAAAELCRIGVLRLGRVADLGLGMPMSVSDGYSLTAFGREWIAARPDAVPRDPGQFMAVLAQFRDKLGPGFMQRAEEAIRCYRTSNYLASCVMCGAAAESVLLAIAVEKTADEKRVLSTYTRASGRKGVVDLIAGKLPVSLQDHLKTYTGLISTWRDEAGHGLPSAIAEPEANMSMLQLIRFAQFASAEWERLTSR